MYKQLYQKKKKNQRIWHKQRQSYKYRWTKEENKHKVRRQSYHMSVQVMLQSRAIDTFLDDHVGAIKLHQCDAMYLTSGITMSFSYSFLSLPSPWLRKLKKGVNFCSEAWSVRGWKEDLEWNRWEDGSKMRKGRKGREGEKGSEDYQKKNIKCIEIPGKSSPSNLIR